MDWHKLLYNNCPICFREMTREMKGWQGAKAKKVYYSCDDCNFTISEQRKEQVLNNLKFEHRSD